MKEGVPEIRMCDLTSRQRRLVEEMREIRYGQIESLVIRGGEPEFQETTKTVVNYKLEGEDIGRSDATEDFTLKARIVRLFEHFRGLGDANVRVLKVVRGLPDRLVIEKRHAGAPPVSDRAVEIRRDQ